MVSVRGTQQGVRQADEKSQIMCVLSTATLLL
jgi:hypothetical protein